MSTDTTWPEGVLARYLTVGGATVDVIEDQPGETTVAKCTGCPIVQGFNWTRASGAHFNGTYRETQDPEQATADARTWAQDHAEKCRAMPKPNPT